MGIALLLPLPGWAIPQFSLLTGNHCGACHVIPAGGALRSELGWYSLHDVGLLQWSHLGLEQVQRWLQQGNSFWDGRLLVGFDFRLQGFQSHNPAYNPRWRLFPMQGALHVGFQPVKALSAEATLNAGRPVFPGQQRWSASLHFHPHRRLPSLRLGFMQPAVGLHYDDHTLLVRRLPGARFDSPQQTYLLAPNVALWGASAMWLPLPEISLTAALFRAGDLSQVRLPDSTGTRPLAEPSELLWNGHLWLFPRSKHLSFWLGSSWLGNRTVQLWNSFAGIGWIDHAALWGEHSLLHTPGFQRWTLTAELDLWLWDALLPYVRLEHGRVTQPAIEPQPYTTQFVAGAQLFVLPFVEVRPEYRWADTEGYRSGRFAVQLHLFY